MISLPNKNVVVSIFLINYMIEKRFSISSSKHNLISDMNVPCDMSPGDLYPLPWHAPDLTIHFYKLKDNDLENVKPTVEALFSHNQ